MRRLLLLVTVGFMIATTPAFALVGLRAECNPQGTEFLIDVQVLMLHIEEDPGEWEMVIEETWLGTCEEPQLVYSTLLPEPTYMPEPYYNAEFSFSVPVRESNQYFFYRAKLRSSTGEIREILETHPSPVAVVSCGEAIASRGFLIADDYLGFYDVVPCQDSCETWLCSEWVDLTHVPEEQWLPFVGTNVPVDVFGTYGLVNPMLGSPCLFATEVRPTPEGICGPVATDRPTWDGLKARFR